MAATGYTMIGLLTPLVALRFGAGPAAVGALVSVGFLLPLVMAVPAGTWADRWGARRMVRVGFLAFAVAALPMTAWPSWTTLIFGFVLANLAHLMYVVGSQALVAELGDPGPAREAAYGWWTTSVAVGQAVGPLVGGVALDLFGARTGFAVMAAVMGLALALTLPMRVSGPRASAPARFEWSTARRLLADRTVGLAMLTSSAALWASTVLYTFLPVHLELLAVPAASIGALLSLRAVVAVVVRPWMPRMVAALGGRERTVVLTLLAMSFGLVGVAFGGGWWWLAVCMVVFGTGFGLSLHTLHLIERRGKPNIQFAADCFGFLKHPLQDVVGIDGLGHVTHYLAQLCKQFLANCRLGGHRGIGRHLESRFGNLWFRLGRSSLMLGRGQPCRGPSLFLDLAGLLHGPLDDAILGGEYCQHCVVDGLLLGSLETLDC